MDSITKHKQIVKKVLDEVMPKNPDTSIQPVRIEDDVRGHYLLYNDTWRGESRIYGCFLHIEVKADGKVWLQHDGTDMIVGQMILDAGVPKSQLVLGFQAPIVRADTGLAVA